MLSLLWVHDGIVNVCYLHIFIAFDMILNNFQRLFNDTSHSSNTLLTITYICWESVYLTQTVLNFKPYFQISLSTYKTSLWLIRRIGGVFFGIRLVYRSIYRTIYSSIDLSTGLSIVLLIHLSIYLWFYLSIYLSIYRPIYRFIYRSIYRSIYSSIYRSYYLLFYPSISLSFSSDLQWLASGPIETGGGSRRIN